MIFEIPIRGGRCRYEFYNEKERDEESPWLAVSVGKSIHPKYHTTNLYTLHNQLNRKFQISDKGFNFPISLRFPMTIFCTKLLVLLPEQTPS